MKRTGGQNMHKALRDTRGQSAVLVAVTLAGVMALCASGIEAGHIYYAYRLLVSSTNAATLAGAQTMSTALLDSNSGSAYTSAVDSTVSQYSSVTGGYNANTFLQNAQLTTTNLYCSTTLEASPFNVACVTPTGGSAGYNAITVTQTAKVPLWFGGLIGMRSLTMAVTSTAAMRGGQNIPYNLAIIMDTTASMQTTIPGDSECTTSQISCAVAGFETMLENMDPCAVDTTCGSSSAYVDDVALFVFPAVSTSYSANDYKSDYCSSGGGGGGGGGRGGGSSVTTVPYNFINVTPGTNQNLNMATSGTNAGSYELVPFNDGYKTTDGTQTLVSTAALAEAVGYSGSGCQGLTAPGGQGTYYAQVIQLAQEALVTQQASNPNSKNVMIILSDGDATAAGSQIVADNTSANCNTVHGSCLNGTGNSSTNQAGGSGATCYGYNCPAYPSAVGECGQAVWAAQQATAAGTLVYTIGFGSETTGCTTDANYTLTGLTDGAETWPSGTYAGKPCNAIAAMASNASTFFSDGSAGCTALDPANANYTSMAQIFQAVVASLSSPRLVPNGT
jgi:hypothetical protein